MDPGSSSCNVRKKSRHGRAKHTKMRLARKKQWQKWRNQKSISHDHCYLKTKEENNGNNSKDYTGHVSKINQNFPSTILDISTSNMSELSLHEETVVDWEPTSASVSQMFQELPSTILDIDSGSNMSFYEEMVVDWEPASAGDFDEWEKTYRELSTSDHENVELHEFSFISEDEYNRVMSHEIEVERMPPAPQEHLKGNRIVDLSYILNWAMKIQRRHSQICTLGELKVEKERHIGLVSIITFTCTMCGRSEEHSTENTTLTKSTINYGAVWGTLSTGNTYTHLKELLGTLDIPCMSYRLFQNIESELGDQWTKGLWASMEECGKQERDLAVEHGQVGPDGIPWTTVYLDGGWSHRSYGHNYNASSGVAVIIGKFTQRMLYLGVRNKYCTVCARAANRHEEPPMHMCFKNWEGSSSAMEADIIVEGFNRSIPMHGLKFTRFIADGDSNVFAKIKRDVSYGDSVEKVACRNHAVKNFGKALYNCKKMTPAAKKLLTKKIIKDLQNFVMRLLYVNAHGNVEKLKQNIGNSMNHVFGDHSLCTLDFCQTPGDRTRNKMDLVKTSGLFFHINGALERLMQMGHQLIDNETNNRAELYMSLLCKFNAGKRLHLTGRGSFQARSMMGGLRYNQGPDWQIGQWKQIIGRSAGENFKKVMEDNKRALLLKSQSISKTPSKKKPKVPKTKNIDYGVHAEQPVLTEAEYTSEYDRHINSLKITPDNVTNIQKETVG